MDRIITKLRAIRLGTDSGKVAAVAACEDSLTDVRLNEFYRTFGRHLGGKCQLTKQTWLFNELRMPQLQSIAAEEASRADLVIVSVHQAQSLPEEVRSWIDLWLKQKASHPRLLLALLDPVSKGDSTSIQTYLKSVAKRGKMEFLAQSEDQHADD